MKNKKKTRNVRVKGLERRKGKKKVKENKFGNKFLSVKLNLKTVVSHRQFRRIDYSIETPNYEISHFTSNKYLVYTTGRNTNSTSTILTTWKHAILNRYLFFLVQKLMLTSN